MNTACRVAFQCRRLWRRLRLAWTEYAKND